MIEARIFKALQAAQEHTLDSDEDILNFIRRELPFSVRGSYGTNTSCVEVIGGDEYIVCDAGTGIRDFGNQLVATRSGKTSPAVVHLFLSHLHWDHIQGFPFFVPAYIPGNRIQIYGCHPGLQQAFENQQQPMHFPVGLHEMRAEISFHLLDTDQTYRIGGFDVKAIAQQHPGTSYGYAFVKEGKKLVYSTDAEHKEDATDAGYPFIDFIRDADLLVFDAQYTLLDTLDTKENWGHSSNLIGVELAVSGGVKRLCLFHMEPTHDDDILDDTLAKTRAYLRIHADKDHPMLIDLAYDGLDVEL
jgi:phosphoribosyl 1,2-cyclic phosphodiesterase